MPDFPKRRLAAIMFTDIIGYTALMGKDERKAFAMMEKNRGIGDSRWNMLAVRPQIYHDVAPCQRKIFCFLHKNAELNQIIPDHNFCLQLCCDKKILTGRQ